MSATLEWLLTLEGKYDKEVRKIRGDNAILDQASHILKKYGYKREKCHVNTDETHGTEFPFVNSLLVSPDSVVNRRFSEPKKQIQKPEPMMHKRIEHMQDENLNRTELSLLSTQEIFDLDSSPGQSAKLDDTSRKSELISKMIRKTFLEWRRKSSDMAEKERTAKVMIASQLKRYSFSKFVKAFKIHFSMRQPSLLETIKERKADSIFSHKEASKFFAIWRSALAKRAPKKKAVIPKPQKPRQIVPDKRAEELIKRGEEDKKKKLLEAKERIAKEKAEEKEKEEHLQREEKRKKRERAKQLSVMKEIRLKKKAEEQMAESAKEAAKSFNRQRLLEMVFRKWPKIIQIRHSEEAKALGFHNSHICSLVFSSFLMVLQVSEDENLQIAEAHFREVILKKSLTAFKRTFETAMQKEFKIAQRHKYYLRKCAICEWHEKKIEKKRLLKAKALSFRERKLKMKTIKALSVGAKALKNEEERQKRREKLIERFKFHMDELEKLDNGTDFTSL